MRAIDRTWQRFGSLVAVHRSANNKRGGTQWLCRCDCGNTCVVYSGNLTFNKQTSCGCKRTKKTGDRFRKHGLSESKIYGVWLAMKGRCYTPSNTSYPWYGAKGVKVDERWRNSFEAFIEDMGFPPKGKTLDRIDPFGDYTPSNCRWATPKEQMSNLRRHQD